MRSRDLRIASTVHPILSSRTVRLRTELPKANISPVPEEMPDGPLHGDKLRGQHGAAGVPESEDTSAQGVQGAGSERGLSRQKVG